MNTELLQAITVFVLAILVGAMLVAAAADNPLSQVLSIVAVAFAAMNVVGGYVVTDRMLQMFRRRPTPAKASVSGDDAGPAA